MISDPAATYETRRIVGLDLACVDRTAAITMIRDAVIESEPRIFGFVNAHTVNMALADPAFATAIGRSTLFNDGVGVDIASKLLYGASFPDNLNGTDLTPAVLGSLPPGTPVFLLGSPEGIAGQAAEQLATRFPAIRIVGAEHGFFSEEDEPAIAARIVASGAKLVLVGMGHPYQEAWAARNVDRIGAVVMCIGAFLDFASGRVRRAPGWIRRSRMEWIYRLTQEPKRLGRRYLIGNMVFLKHVVRQRLTR